MTPRSFQQRYLFTGILTLKTGLHIGSGWTAGSASRNPVIRTPDGKPFIPGSSFKGAFRSTVEKMASVVGVSSCQLMEGQGCVGTQGAEQRAFNQRIVDNSWSDEELLEALDEELCDTCKLFGSNFMASRVFFADLLPGADDETATSMIQVRDGVAIDRDSEKAVDQRKFDYEVVAPAQTFLMEIVLEDPGGLDLPLTCLGLNEFVSGFAYLGGKRSRGLGNCRIEELAVYELDLKNCDSSERISRLKKYLLGKSRDDKMTRVPDAQAFLEAQIEQLPALREEDHA